MSDLEAQIAEVLAKHQPSRWRSLTNENEILRCCGQDFGNLAKKAKRDDDAKMWAAFTAHQAAKLAPVIAEAQAEALHEAAAYFDARATKLVETTVALPGRPDTTEADIHRYGAYAAEAQNAASVLTRMAKDQEANNAHTD